MQAPCLPQTQRQVHAFFPDSSLERGAESRAVVLTWVSGSKTVLGLQGAACLLACRPSPTSVSRMRKWTNGRSVRHVAAVPTPWKAEAGASHSPRSSSPAWPTEQDPRLHKKRSRRLRSGKPPSGARQNCDPQDLRPWGFKVLEPHGFPELPMQSAQSPVWASGSPLWEGGARCPSSLWAMGRPWRKGRRSKQMRCTQKRVGRISTNIQHRGFKSLSLPVLRQGQG